MPADMAISSDRADRDRWLAIELRHLAALATVAQEASFSGAADSLGYVQSAVSQQISSLERIVGRRLVDRSARPRSVKVTDAGMTLLEHVDSILEQLRLAKADVDALSGQPGSVVSLGIASIFGSWLPAAVLGALLGGPAGSGWTLAEPGPAEALLQAVAGGQLDAAFVPLPVASGPFFAAELARQPCVLAAPADPGGRPGDVDAVLDRWPLVRIEGCDTTKALLERHRAARVLHSAPGPVSALALVRSGAAAAVVTGLDVPADDPAIATIPLPDLPGRIVGIAWHRDRDDCAAVVSLREAARRACCELDAEGDELR